MTDARINYTGATIVEKKEEDQTAPKWGKVGQFGCFTTDEEGKAVWNEGKVLVGTTATEYDDVEEGAEYTYIYDNKVIPQNDLPQLTAQMKGIELAAKARRIAIYYSQMAAFQAKTEMGIDLGEILATQACAELSYKQICSLA